VREVLEDGVLVREQQQRVLEREQQHEEQEQEQEQAQAQEQAQEPTHHHNLWLRWQGSKKSFSSTRQMSFSKLHRRRCANC